MTGIMNYLRRSRATDSGIEMSATITASSSSPSWGVIELKDLRDKDNNPVDFTKDDYLGIALLSPVKVEDTEVNVSTDPWYDFTCEVSNFSSGNDVEVLVKITFKPNWDGEADKFQVKDVQLEMAGDPQDEHYKDSVRLWKNSLPDETGTVPIVCDSRPDGIPYSNQTVVFTNDDGIIMKEVPFGQKTEVTLNRGNYGVAATEVFTDDETTVATAKAQPDQVEVKQGTTSSDVNVTYDVHHYSATDVVIDNIAGLEGEEVHVKFSSEDSLLHDFWSSVPQITKPRRVLPSDGNATISVDSIIVNNVQYEFTPKQVDLSSNESVLFTAGDVTQHQIEVSDAVKLPIQLKKSGSITAGTMVVHLIQKDTRLIYKEKVDMDEENPQFQVLVAPGDYEVQANRFIENGILYKPTFDPSITVNEDGNTELELQVDLVVNLNVPGFPNFLSFGACTRDLSEPTESDDTDNDLTDFVQAGASSIFKYAGQGGDGDPEVDLTESLECTPRVIALASNIEKAIGSDHTVLPVLISYTCNFSGGNDVLTDTTRHRHSLGNFIQSLQLTMKSDQAPRSLRAAYILNPDFIGECQKRGYEADSEVPFLNALKEALEYRGEADKVELIPSDIDDTLRGYVRALHWLVRTLTKDPDTGKPAVSLGWQVNLWAGEAAGAVWIYTDENQASDKAKKTADYLDELGVWPKQASQQADEDELAPLDFLAVDRWERDDYRNDSYPKFFCFAPREWSRYFDFCETLGAELHAPIMPWQVSAARTPTFKDDVSNNFSTAQHWGTGGSCILGDPGIGSEYYRIHKKILSLGLDEVQFHVKTVEELWKRSQPFDISVPGYQGLHLRGIFAVLLGGGDTTGIVSSLPQAGEKQDAWVRERLGEYIKDPIYFQTD
ncbi:hypothetical protein AtubIFM55763_007402 [Aspergillus tubingensis]|uniref:Uncharacterized protein n=2 Tax=Aspergillus subgen. Circumdati TaxID=2720871 RepID=A0A100IG29_ASPNG|nr:hypothetical protein AKAW_08513 [Aspergillus niger]GLA56439.1 hypothetical protein AtubIFM54640_000091 [Aspergillus tubingensis]GLA75846.1 hypothetical protein AtubIFM55763_007402 [Aspergillus tubingensis]GLA86386.1 hypothetical protein AtubIFM56815_010651 [Aspergillus tubingensis]GLA93674.1 hypothetical protein AtubIFM57143_011274 [Aspergillus tubingensis]